MILGMFQMIEPTQFSCFFLLTLRVPNRFGTVISAEAKMFTQRNIVVGIPMFS